MQLDDKVVLVNKQYPDKFPQVFIVEKTTKTTYEVGGKVFNKVTNKSINSCLIARKATSIEIEKYTNYIKSLFIVNENIYIDLINAFYIYDINDLCEAGRSFMEKADVLLWDYLKSNKVKDSFVINEYGTYYKCEKGNYSLYDIYKGYKLPSFIFSNK